VGHAEAVNTELFLRVVRGSMLAGAAYDLAFAFPILLAPARLSGVIGLPMPDQEIYLRFTGVFLLGAAGFYLLPVLHPGRYLGNVVVAAALRAAGGLFLIEAVIAYDQPRPLLVLGALDLTFAGVHYLSLVPFSGFKVWRLAGADLSPRRVPTGDR
jgi:hypothetical protein